MNFFNPKDDPDKARPLAAEEIAPVNLGMRGFVETKVLVFSRTSDVDTVAAVTVGARRPVLSP